MKLFGLTYDFCMIQMKNMLLCKRRCLTFRDDFRTYHLQIFPNPCFHISFNATNNSTCFLKRKYHILTSFMPEAMEELLIKMMLFDKWIFFRLHFQINLPINNTFHDTIILYFAENKMSYHLKNVIDRNYVRIDLI